MTKYTPEEIKFIKTNYRKLRSKEIAEALGRSVDAIRIWAKRNGLTKTRQNPAMPKTRVRHKHQHSDHISKLFSIMYAVKAEYGHKVSTADIINGAIAYIRSSNGGKAWMVRRCSQ